MKLDKDFRMFDAKVREKFEAQPAEVKARQRKAVTFILFQFELNYKMKETFDVKESESLHLIKEHLKTHKRAYVATSHGKDSVVMVHLIWRACQELGIPMIEVWLNDTLNTYKEEPTYWKEFNAWLGIEDKFRKFMPPKDPDTGKYYTVWSIAKKFGHLPNFRQHASTGLPYNKRKVPECCDILKKESIKKLLKELPKEERFDLCFVGTRAEENRNRRVGVLQRCRSYLIKTRVPYPIRTVTPLSFWTKTDVYLYFSKYKIPVNPAYEVHRQERLGCASCPAHKNWERRLAKDPTKEGLGMLRQNLIILKNTEPERYLGSIKNLQDYLKSNISNIEVLYDSRMILNKMLAELENEFLITDFT